MFQIRFALTDTALRANWSGPPAVDLQLGIASRRFRINPEQAPGALGLLAGTTLTSVLLVLEGLRTWRDAGSDAAELVLRGRGVDAAEARRVATLPLPELAEGRTEEKKIQE